ncbi:hypothetical protein F443_23047, partial [Phytophthora nicotianae P1569]
MAKAAGATTIITSSSDEKLQFVKEKFGVEYTINYRKTPEWAAEAPVVSPAPPLRASNGSLCIRVVAYDEFVRYEEQLRLDDRPLHPIPVLLGPNETMVEYERDFELWLAIRNVSLESLQGHPGVERLFRLDHSNSRYMELRRQYCGTKTQPVSYEERGPPDKWRHNEEMEWAAEANRFTNGRGVDVVIETGGSGTIAQSMEAIKPGGQIAVIGFLFRAKQEEMPDVAGM